MTDLETNVGLLLDRAQARLDAQSRDNDALDVKALGVVATDAAIFALMAIVHHEALNSWWAIPACAIAAGGVLLIASVFRQDFDAGPEWRDFYQEFGALPPEPFALQMFSDLLQAVEWNDTHGRRWKDWLYEWGFRASAAGIVIAGFTPFFR